MIDAGIMFWLECAAIYLAAGVFITAGTENAHGELSDFKYSLIVLAWLPFVIWWLLELTFKRLSSRRPRR